MTQEQAFERHDDHDKLTIIVNTRRKELTTDRLSFVDVVRLAYPDATFGPDILYTVTYRAGPRENPAGDLTEGQSVMIKDGMIFNVKQTNRS